ncbi:MAG: signal peptidase II [Novosphingobium sp.]|nr:signal peptidase II [Novosphingobium sp.]
MSPLAARRLTGLLLAAAIFLIDQLVKWLVVGPLALREREVIGLLPFFDLRWTQNFGVSLGMLTANSMEMRWILVGVTALIGLGVFVWMLREKATWDIAALALVLGGALGNIRDRARFGYVIDYADFHIGEFRPFLIFNIADAAITIGVVIILARSFFLREKPGKTETDQTGNSPAET